MTEAVEELEQRITRLRTAVREAVLAGDRGRAGVLRRELRQAEQDWEDALTRVQQAGRGDREQPAEPAGSAAGARVPLLPLRNRCTRR